MDQSYVCREIFMVTMLQSFLCNFMKVDTLDSLVEWNCVLTQQISKDFMN